MHSLEQYKAWKLEDAKARFSELVRQARDKTPQRVTVHGKDAVVVVSAQTFEKVAPFLEEPDIHHLLSESPLADLDFTFPSFKTEVRDVSL